MREMYDNHFSRCAPADRISKIEELIKQRLVDTLAIKSLNKEGDAKIQEILNSFHSFGSLVEEYNGFLDFLNQRGYHGGTNISRTVPYEDVFPLLLFKYKFFGTPDFRFIKHLLIDEMQDYTPVQYEILNMMFTCPKTIMGDIEQAVDPFTNIGSLDTLRSLYGESNVFLELNTSYRSSYEITEVAKSILGGSDYEAVSRHGDCPVLTEVASDEEQALSLLDDIARFTERGYGSIAVMCKTGTEAENLWKRVKDKRSIRLLINPDQTYNQGVIITTCAIAKGLEFDCVLIPNCDDTNYRNPYGRKPLYVACTRALHQLRFYCHAGHMSEYLVSARDGGLLKFSLS